MKIYLASRYSRREEMVAAAALLVKHGHIVTSRWILGDHQVDDRGLSEQAHEAERTRFATEDYDDLRAADCTISFTEPPRSTSSRGGRHVEFGMAMALGQLCVVIGPRENVFHCLPKVVVLPAFDHFMEWIDIAAGVVEVKRSERAAGRA